MLRFLETDTINSLRDISSRSAHTIYNGINNDGIFEQLALLLRGQGLQNLYQAADAASSVAVLRTLRIGVVDTRTISLDGVFHLSPGHLRSIAANQPEHTLDFLAIVRHLTANVPGLGSSSPIRVELDANGALLLGNQMRLHPEMLRQIVARGPGSHHTAYECDPSA
jgi:hypothetical protein